jgi:hypothetical protein
VLQTPPRKDFFLDDDNAGGKMTQEEISDNKLIAKIFDIGLRVQLRDEVGISMLFKTPPNDDGDPDCQIKYICPDNFDSLNYRQQQFIIELMKEALNGRHAGGKFVLEADEVSYAESLGFQHRDLLSVANFAVLYMADSMSNSDSYYQRFDPVCDSKRDKSEERKKSKS